MLSMAKSTISMAIFNSKLLVYQRVNPIDIPLNHYKIPSEFPVSRRRVDVVIFANPLVEPFVVNSRRGADLAPNGDFSGENHRTSWKSWWFRGDFKGIHWWFFMGWTMISNGNMRIYGRTTHEHWGYLGIQRESFWKTTVLLSMWQHRNRCQVWVKLQTTELEAAEQSSVDFLGFRAQT